MISNHEQAATKEAAFFDVDGTITATTIVDYYAYFKRRRLGSVVGGAWYAAFLVKCLYYLVLDKIDRSRLNIIFYRSYAGWPVTEIMSHVDDCHRDVILPRRFVQALDCIVHHKSKGRQVIFVTGSIDFIMEPLARELKVDAVLAPSLLQSDGKFTGELDGPPIGQEEKARRVRSFAEQNQIDLERSYAYGDSIADLPMLELVGLPNAVNPDKSLKAVASSRGWPVHHWTVARPPPADPR